MVSDIIVWYFLYSKEKIGNRESKMKAEKADQFSEMSLIEITKSLAKMWRELPLEDKHMVTESFDKVTGSYNLWDSNIVDISGALSILRIQY